MPVTCTPESLVAASVCLDCLDDNIEAADIYLLCQWANTEITEEDTILEEDGAHLLDESGVPILLE